MRFTALLHSHGRQSLEFRHKRGSCARHPWAACGSPWPVLTCALLVSLRPAAYAQEMRPFQPQFHPTLQVERAAGAITIDGELEDAGWTSAARVTGFCEVEPGDQVRPPVESEAWMTYDETNLYIALIAYDDPTQVRASLRERDDIFTDDYFGLMLDTYGDLAWAYELYVNPLGIQGDLRMLRGGVDEDISLDLVWTSRGTVTNRGYQVEIAVPFASLRFPDRPEQVWRANFWRDHQRDTRRRYAWAAIDRGSSCWMCNWGTITGVRGVRPGRNLDVIAGVTGLQNHRREPSSGPSSHMKSGPIDGEASLNLRYGLSSDASAEITLNPDFSQIESDAGEIDINNPYAIFYPEKRPFFQEGSDLYATWITAISTRSIQDPSAASKLTGRKGNTAGAWLIARDERSPVVLPQEERSHLLQAGRSLTNFARLRHSFGHDSYVGGLATDRRLDGGGSGTTFGLDGSLRFRGSYRLDLQALASHTEEPDDTLLTSGLNQTRIAGTEHSLGFDGERFWGNALYAQLSRQARRLDTDVTYFHYSPAFRVDNGSISRTDYREADISGGLSFYPNRPWLRTWNAHVTAGRLWDYAGRFQDEWLVPAITVTTRRQTTASLELLWSRERFREVMFDGIRRVEVNLNSRWSARLGTELEIRAGRTILRTFSAPPILGRTMEIEAGASFRPTQRLLLEPALQYSRMRAPDGRSTVFEGHILRGALRYLFSRNLSTRLIVEYDDFDDQLRLEPLLTYRHNAFTVMYLGMSADAADSEWGGDPTRSHWKLSRAQVFLKLQYLLQI